MTTFLAFPHPLGDGVLDLGAGLAWLAPACLLAAVGGLPPRRAAAVGFAAALLAHAAVLHWIYVVTVTYGRAPPAVGVVAPILLAGYVAMFGGAFGAGASWLAAGRLASPLSLAALWTALDHLRSFFLSGFPWATLGYAQHANPALMGLAPWTGVYGLSFASVLVASSALAWRARDPAAFGGRRAAVVGAAAAALLLALGALQATRPDPPSTASVRIAVLQGNINQGVKWTPNWAERTLGIYESLSRQAVARGARVVVWPETAAPGSPDGDPVLRARLAGLAAELGVTLVVGAVGIDGLSSGPVERARLYDSAFLLGPDGAALGRYDKTHLVPFGEYLPLRPLLGQLIRAIATGSAGRDVSAGAAPRRVDLPLGPAGTERSLPAGAERSLPAGAERSLPAGAERSLPAGVPICYELLFPDLVRRFVGDGAGILLGITNDAWYGRTGAPHQFLAITSLRSAETGVWTARAANTGVSAFIDPRGRVRGQTQIFERGLLVDDVPIRAAGSGETFYVRHGDVFAKACWGGLATAGVIAAWRRRRSS